MTYAVTVYENFDEIDVLKSDSFDTYSNAIGWGAEEAEKLAGSEGIEHLEGAPDFAAEIDVVGTPSVVVVRQI